MKRARANLVGLLLLGMLVVAAAPADGVEDFRLTKAIPSDAMLVFHNRTHAGMDFVNEQYDRVWKAIEAQHFEKDLEALIQGLMKNAGGDTAALDQQWQQIRTMADEVDWSGLAGQESAFAMKVGMPMGADLVFLMIPTEGKADAAFKGLASILKQLVAMAPAELELGTDGEGETVVHTVPLSTAPPLKLTLARYKDVLLIGVGTAMAEQSLALLRGETAEATATLASTERFKKAFSRLPEPEDGLLFIDTDQLMVALRQFADMAVKAVASTQAAGPDGTAPANPTEALPKLVDALDLWQHVAGVTATDGMQTRSETLAVLRPDANQRPLHMVLYSHGPLEEPLKYVPKIASDVSVTSGVNLQAAYAETLNFVRQNVPEGEAMIAQFMAMQAEHDFDLERDVLSWIGGEYITFSAPIPTPYLPSWVWIIEVTDKEKALLALDQVCVWYTGIAAEQGGAVEEATDITGVEGFRRIQLPNFFAMLPGLGKLIIGVHEGHLFIGNGPQIVNAAIEAGAGTAPRFTENERYQSEGLPIEGPVTAFAFQDLSKLGQTLGQMLPALAFGLRLAAPDVGKDPVANTLLRVMTKAGEVAKTLDFLKSSCSVTKMEGKDVRSITVMNYQKPPYMTAPPPETKPEAEKPAQPAGESATAAQ